VQILSEPSPRLLQTQFRAHRSRAGASPHKGRRTGFKRGSPDQGAPEELAGRSDRILRPSPFPMAFRHNVLGHTMRS
jgi:hypothetical protein